MGEDVIKVMGYDTGFTHMEWYLKSNGEAVFGEIAARPPGARTVDLMNYSSDVDLFVGWAEAELHGTFSPVIERKYNTACITKRAIGQGRIQRIEGLDRVRERCGEWLCTVDLLPIGATRRNWKNTLLSDGYLLRHPDWEETDRHENSAERDIDAPLPAERFGLHQRRCARVAPSHHFAAD